MKRVTPAKFRVYFSLVLLAIVVLFSFLNASDATDTGIAEPLRIEQQTSTSGNHYTLFHQQTAAVDFVNQYEIGFKHRGDIFDGDGYYTLEVTLLKGDFKQSTFELSGSNCGVSAGGCVIDAEYKSQGAEILGAINYNGLTIVGNATITDAEKLAAGSSEWVRADGIPDMMYTVSSNYDINDQFQVGLNVTGQTTSVDGAGNEWPSAATFGGHFRYSATENLQFGLSGYNLTDKFDLRGNGGAVNTSGDQAVISGAPAIGRTLMASVKVSF